MTQLKQYQKEIVKIFKEYDKTGTKTWDYKRTAFDLPYQVGSLTKCLSQLEGVRYNDGLSKKEIMAKVADELSDILAEVLFISHELNIDIEKAWENMKASDKTKISTRSKLLKKKK